MHKVKLVGLFGIVHLPLEPIANHLKINPDTCDILSKHFVPELFLIILEKELPLNMCIMYLKSFSTRRQEEELPSLISIF